MSLTPRIDRRIAVVPFLVALLVLSVSGIANAGGSVPPDQTSGSMGHYTIYDASSAPGATCSYATSGSKNKLYEIDVKAPKVYWPDQSSSNHHEHGKITFSVWLQQSSMPEDSTAWHTIYKTPVEKATAYENTKAPLTDGMITWHSSHNVYFRVSINLTWIHSFGTTNGTLKHWDTYYAMAGSFTSVTPSVGNCANVIAF